MAEQIVVMLKRIPVIAGFILILVGIVLVFVLPILVVPIFTEPAEDVNKDWQEDSRALPKYREMGDFTISGTITYETRYGDLYYSYKLDDSEFIIKSGEDLGDKDDFIMVKVSVESGQNEETKEIEDYLRADALVNQLIYNVPGFIIFIIGIVLFLFGLIRKAPEERASKEKAIARKRALDKELDLLERDLQTSIVGQPQPGMPGMPGQPVAMPPGGAAPAPGMPPQQPPGVAVQPGMPPAQVPPQVPPQQPGQVPPGAPGAAGAAPGQPVAPPQQMPGAAPPGTAPAAPQQLPPQRPAQPPGQPPAGAPPGPPGGVPQQQPAPRQPGQAPGQPNVPPKRTA